MANTCTIHIDDEVNCCIGGLRPEHLKVLYDKFGVYVDGYQHMPLFQLRRWDGKTHFFSKDGKTFTNLLSEIIPYLCSWDYQVNFNDKRVAAPVITDSIDVDFFNIDNFKLRQYQVDVINTLLHEGCGFAICATGAGKCLAGETLITLDVPVELAQALGSQVKKRVVITVMMSALFDAISKLKSVEFIDEVSVDVSELNILVDTPSGLQPVVSLIKKTASTRFIHLGETVIHCADQHRFMREDQEVRAIDLGVNESVTSRDGLREVTMICEGEVEAVYDIEVAHSSHIYYTTDGILHHNTSICAALSLMLYVHGMQTLIIVPSSDLVTQTIDEFREKLTSYPVTIGEYSGSQKDIDHPIVVATWQSLQNVPHYMSFFQAFIVDECHGAKANVIQTLINKYGRNISHRYGVTGTFPKSITDQYALRCSIGSILTEIPASWLMDQGYLSRLEIQPIEIQDKADLPDYASERAYIASCDDRLDKIAQLIIESRDVHGNTLVLVNSIPQGRQLQELIPDSIFLSGESGKDLRKENYSMFDDNDNLIVIATMGIASTGISIDRIFCEILVDIGKSFIKCIQAVGRGLRKKGDKNYVLVKDIHTKLKFGRKHYRDRLKYYKEASYTVLPVEKVKY